MHPRATQSVPLFITLCLKNSATTLTMCWFSGQASRATLDCLHEQMISFESAMQCQMDDIASFVVSSHPMMVAAIPQDSSLEVPPPSSVPASDPPAPSVTREAVLSTPVVLVDSQPHPLQPAPGMHLKEDSPVAYLQPSMLASARDDASSADGKCAHRVLFESFALKSFSHQSVGYLLGPCPTAAMPL